LSAASEGAELQLVLADFAQAGGDGKVHIVGAGIATLGFDPQQGVTSRFSLYVAILVPSELCPLEVALEVALYQDGELYELPSPTGTGQALRIGQVLSIEAPNNPTMSMVQRHYTGSRHQAVFDFGNGLPLAPGGRYEWQVRLDGDDDRKSAYRFAVSGPPPAPVLG